jgi:hypothetical protein
MSTDLVVEEIDKQLGQIAGYTDLSIYQRDPTSTLLEVLFTNPESSKKAYLKGLTLEGQAYYGSPWMDITRRNIVKVHLSHVPLKMYNNLQVELLRNMKCYGTVLQICKHTNKFGKIFWRSFCCSGHRRR